MTAIEIATWMFWWQTYAHEIEKHNTLFSLNRFAYTLPMRNHADLTYDSTLNSWMPHESVPWFIPNLPIPNIPQGNLVMGWEAAYSQHLGLRKWERERMKGEMSHQNAGMIVKLWITCWTCNMLQTLYQTSSVQTFKFDSVFSSDDHCPTILTDEDLEP